MPAPASFTATSRVSLLMAALDQVWRRSTSGGFAANSLKFATSASRIRSREESSEESNAITGSRSLPPCGGGLGRGVASSEVCPCGPPPHKGEGRSKQAPTRTLIANPQFVFATRGGVAMVMNWVASSMAGPSGVGTFMRNGTRIRVPATGANAISMLRWAARYLMTGRSGM
jgi:hypothetical protein